VIDQSQPHLPDQHLDDADAAVMHAVDTLGEFIMNVARPQHRTQVFPKRSLVQAVSNFSLALLQLSGYLLAHSKWLLSSL